MRKILTIEKEQFEGLIKDLNLKRVKCGLCKKELTKDNLGILGKNFYSCDNKFCLKAIINEMQLYDLNKASPTKPYASEKKK